nr:head GIN domain-containing protein [Polymorphobacter sp.]
MIAHRLAVGMLALAAAPTFAAERSYTVGSFDRLAVAGSSDVAVTTGKAISVRASGDEAALDKLEITVENGTLQVRNKSRYGMNWGGNAKTRVVITVPMLRTTDVAGSGNVTVDRIDTPDFTASVSGSGGLNLPKLTTAKSRFSVAGSGNVSAAGTSTETKASVAGSGNLNIPGLKSSVLSASVSGSGSVDAFATTTASVSVAGSGDVRVRGGARCAISKSGSGSVDCG